MAKEKPEEREAKVRPLAAAGLSTRKIASALDMSQPTVHRTVKRINSGPHPILRPDEPPTDSLPVADSCTEPFPAPDPEDTPAQQPARNESSRESPRVGWIVLIAMVTLAAIVASAVWYKLAQAPATGTRIGACAQYSPDGRITRMKLAIHHRCSEGWQFVNLIPG